MILLVSHDSIDEPTNDVMDWLSYYNANFKRINGDNYDAESNFTVDFSNLCIKEGENLISNDDINVLWYRRWINRPVHSVSYEFLNNVFTNNEGYFFEAFYNYLKSELTSIVGSILPVLSNSFCIPNIRLARGGLNKMETLLNAKKIGLKVPNSIITTSKNELLRFISNHNGVITKSIRDAELIIIDGNQLDLYTKAISYLDAKELGDNFFPTLFQEKIEKEFEIRTFFIEDNFYSMAIFSQNDKTTSVDFRNYNNLKPNRFVPFNLPNNILEKLKELMKILDLNTGSIDLLFSKDTNEYYFLEVNPVGQIGMVSNNCNYPIEKLIAQTLIKYDKKKHFY